MELPKLVYDDFYKFVTSFTLISFLISAISITYELIYVKGMVPFWLLGFTIVFYLVLAGISVYFFFWAIKKWRYNQELSDRKLEAETEQAEITTELSKKELKNQIDSKVKEIPLQEQSKLKTKIEQELSRISSENLDLMSIRYLIEERINNLLELMNYPKKTYRSLANSLFLLKQSEVFDKHTTSLIKEVVHICNKAIHANKVSREEHAYVMDVSEKILFLLEEMLKNKLKI